MNDLKLALSARGFTMIELMIVVGVVGILVAVAVPAYNDYTIRSKVAECINGAAVGKLGISEYRQTLGAWPPNLQEAGLSVSGISHYCTSLDNYQPDSGAFTVNVNESAIDPGLGELAPILEPFEADSDIITWTCTRGATSAANARYLPASCREI